MTNNLFDDLPQHLPTELVTKLLEAGSLRIERIVSHGHASPEGFWYDQTQAEWVIVLKGGARLRFEGGEPLVEMKPGFCEHPGLQKAPSRVDDTRRADRLAGRAYGDPFAHLRSSDAQGSEVDPKNGTVE